MNTYNVATSDFVANVYHKRVKADGYTFSDTSKAWTFLRGTEPVFTVPDSRLLYIELEGAADVGKQAL